MPGHSVKHITPLAISSRDKISRTQTIFGSFLMEQSVYLWVFLVPWTFFEIYDGVGVLFEIYYGVECSVLLLEGKCTLSELEY